MREHLVLEHTSGRNQHHQDTAAVSAVAAVSFQHIGSCLAAVLAAAMAVAVAVAARQAQAPMHWIGMDL